MKNSLTTKISLMEKKQKVLSWIMEVGDEIESLATARIQEKFLVMLFMTYIDIFTQVWDVFSGNPASTQKQRFINWVDKYVINQKHRDSMSDFGPLTSENLYKIRNSLLHYAGLPNIGFPVFISKYPKSALVLKYPDNKNQLVHSLVITSNLLGSEFSGAFANMWTDIDEMSKTDEEKYDHAISILYEKLQKDCAMRIRI